MLSMVPLSLLVRGRLTQLAGLRSGLCWSTKSVEGEGQETITVLAGVNCTVSDGRVNAVSSSARTASTASHRAQYSAFANAFNLSGPEPMQTRHTSEAWPQGIGGDHGPRRKNRFPVAGVMVTLLVTPLSLTGPMLDQPLGLTTLLFWYSENPAGGDGQDRITLLPERVMLSAGGTSSNAPISLPSPPLALAM